MNFYDNLEKFSPNIALITEGSKHISYKELRNIADEISKHVDRRSIVLVIGSNSTELIIGYIGLLRRRAVIILINEETHISYLKKLIKLYKPEYIFKPLKKFKLNYKKILNYNNYHLLKTEYNHKNPPYAELALLLSTSGSTGSPKFVRQSYKNINCNSDAIVKYLKISSNDRLITTLQPNYTYGLSMINTHILKGASIILTNLSIVEKKFWSLLNEKKATTFGGVPFTYEILNKLNFKNMNLPSLKYITQAGGKLNNNVLKKINDACDKMKIKFFIMYGQTEATARMSYLPYKYNKKKIGSIGVPINGGKFTLIDNKGKTIEENGTSGELVYKGDNVSLGYAKKYIDLKREDDNKGTLLTGDLAQKDSENFYYIVGRKKRFLKIFGNRVNLDELEKIIRDLDYDCACTGTDQKIKIFLAKNENKNYLKKFIPKLTNIHPSGFIFKNVKRIPRNSTGKILYSKLF